MAPQKRPLNTYQGTKRSGSREYANGSPETEQEAVLDLLRLMNRNDGIHELIKDVTILMRDWSGCEAVGVRLRDGDDFPYFETRGFAEEHVRLENRLCAVDGAGETIRDSSGNPVLECMCGNVLSGRFDPALPFFTESGSFWTGSTSELLTSTSEADRQARTRNRCHGEGYESVLLAPVGYGSEILGLLQLNDSRKHVFTPQLVETVERLASHLGIGLKQREQAQELLDQEEKLAAIYSHIPQATLLVDPQRRVRSVNPAAEALAGSPEEELVGRRGGEALRCLHHLDDPRGCGFGPECDNCVVSNTVLATFSTGESFFQEEAELPTIRDGVRDTVTILVSSSLLQLKNGPHILVTMEDISERKRMERAMRRKDDELAMLLDHIPTQVFYFVDPETYGAVNRAHADFLGLPKIDIEYNRVEKVLSPEPAFRCREDNKLIFANGRALHTYTWLSDSQGRWRLFSLSRVPYFNGSEKPEYIVCSGQEITSHLAPTRN